MKISLGQSAGARHYRVGLDAVFDFTDQTAAIEDVLSVYLVNPSDPNQTMLDRGSPGTALFSLTGLRAEFAPGIARWDGSVLELDLSSVTNHDTALLKFQLLNSDGDAGSRVTIVPLSNVVDLVGQPSTPTASSKPVYLGGDATDLTKLSTSINVTTKIENVRFNSGTGRYTAELSLQNRGFSIGREIAVVFPGLPSGVALSNASGTTETGEPYLNLKPSIPSGGLGRGMTSAPVLIEIDSPAQVAFAIKPRVLANTNQAPILAAIPTQTVKPGGVLRVPLQATDIDGDRIAFSMRGSTALPTNTLHADGTLEFRPKPTETGTFTFDVTASDGALDVSRSVTVNVVADPVTTTRISGRVLQINGGPLANVPVEVGAVKGLTSLDRNANLFQL